jgi:hypothetical protein
MTRLLVAVLLGALAAAGPGLVRPAGGGEAAPDVKALTPEERGRIRENLERWRQLPPEEKERIRGDYQHWKQLSPEERQTIRRRFEDYQKLPPQDRQRLREEFRRQADRAPMERARPPAPGQPPLRPPGQRPNPGAR